MAYWRRHWICKWPFRLASCGPRHPRNPARECLRSSVRDGGIHILCRRRLWLLQHLVRCPAVCDFRRSDNTAMRKIARTTTHPLKQGRIGQVPPIGDFKMSHLRSRCASGSALQVAARGRAQTRSFSFFVRYAFFGDAKHPRFEPRRLSNLIDDPEHIQ